MRARYTRPMRSENLKSMFLVGWVVTVCLAALVLGVTSLTHWVVTAFVAVVPAIVARSLWHVPERTMSENIHDARG